MFFCPNCDNLLLVKQVVNSSAILLCKTCPYVYTIRKKVSSRIYPRLKAIDHVIGFAAAWENVDSTNIECPACSHNTAYFMQLQIRSADEPMTTFYKCANQVCSQTWRD